MKVIVKVSGFYGGNWIDAGPREVEMNDKVAKQFLPPRGEQLSLPKTAKRMSQPMPTQKSAKAD